MTTTIFSKVEMWVNLFSSHACLLLQMSQPFMLCWLLMALLIKALMKESSSTTFLSMWEMGELTKEWVSWPIDRDGGLDQWWRWVSWPLIEMGELTNDGNGWVEQCWWSLSWPMMKMGEQTNDEYLCVDNDGDRWVDQWWTCMKQPRVESGELRWITSHGGSWSWPFSLVSHFSGWDAWVCTAVS